MKNRTLSADLVRHLFSYDGDKGILRWKNPTAYCMSPGDIAGTMSGAPGNQYLNVSVNRCVYRAHRIIWCFMTGVWPSDVVDHIDGDTFNNRFANLRECTQAENCRNQRIRSANRSGFKGVHQHKNGKWIAQISDNYKKIYLGIFERAEDAHTAYLKAAAVHHGIFARAA